MTRHFLKYSALIALGILLWPSAAFAISSEEIEKALRAKKILAPDVQIRSTIQANEAHVSTVPDKNAKDTPERYKIDAVLIAKTIMDVDKSIVRVFVRFYDRITVELYTEVTVRSVDIKAFGSGLTTQQELLDSLNLVSGTDLNARALSGNGAVLVPPAPAVVGSIEVVEGPLKDERQKLGMRIQTLKTKGVGVKPFLDQFASLEEMAKVGEGGTPLLAKMDALSDSVSDQEKVLAEHIRDAAKRVTPAVSGRTPAPVTAIVSAAPSSVAGSKVDLTTALLASRAGENPILNEMFGNYVANAVKDPALQACQGPLRLARARMGWIIYLRRGDGFNVDAAVRMFQQTQSLAAANRDAELRPLLLTMAQNLKVGNPITDDLFYFNLWHKQHEHEEHSHRDRDRD